MPALAPRNDPIGPRQRRVLRYVTFVLVDLCVLGLFDEYTSLVYVESFTIALLIAVVLQVALKLTLWAKTRLTTLAQNVDGFKGKALRAFLIWMVSFWSKFVIFEVVDFLFGGHLEIYGVKAMFVLLIVLFVVEVLAMRLFWSTWLVEDDVKGV